MAIIKANAELLRAMVYGGAVLGGGGGGQIEDGLARGQLALSLGTVYIADIDELDPADFVVTVSSVGSPKSTERYIEPSFYTRSLQILSKHTNVPVRGVVSCENGAAGTINGWLHAAILPGICVVDAPANGHAHPTGLMGAMCLHKVKNFISKQCIVGGNPELSRYAETYTEGSLNACSDLARRAADQAGGVVAVARNPVPASYVKQNAATGGLAYAASIGRAMLEKGIGEEIVLAAAKATGGQVVAEGCIQGLEIQTKNAFDIGLFHIRSGSEDYTVSVMNEYLTLEKNGVRLATFPDLIMVFDATTGRPMTSSRLEENQRIIVITVPWDKMPLSAAMFCPELYDAVEEKAGVSLKKYLP